MKSTFYVLAIFLSLLLFTNKSFSQQDFKTNYKFGKIKQGSGKVTLLKKTKVIKGKDTTEVYLPFKLDTTFKYPGIIKKRNEEEDVDTFFLKLWPIGTRSNKGLNESVQQKQLDQNTTGIKNDNFYALEVEKWPVHSRHNSLDIPFSTNELSQITIPLRFNLRTHEFSDEFLNVSISWSRIWGKTRFYESEFVKPRDRFWGLGGFSGITMTKNKDDRSEVGVMYGANLVGSVFGVNLVLAAGAESSIGKRSLTSPFIGFGIDFDLFKLSGVKSGSGE